MADAEWEDAPTSTPRKLYGLDAKTQKLASLGTDGYPTDKVPHEFNSDEEVHAEIAKLQDNTGWEDAPVGNPSKPRASASNSSDDGWEDAKAEGPSMWETAKGMGEAGANFLSGMPAGLAGGVNFLGALAGTKGDLEAAKAVKEGTEQRINDKIQYEPRSKMGKRVKSDIDEGFQQAIDHGGKAMKDLVNAIPFIGDKLGAAAGDDLLETLGRAGTEMALNVAPFEAAIPGRGLHIEPKTTMNLEALGRDIPEPMKAEVPLVPMEAVPPRIETTDPFGQVPETPLPELNMWDGTQSRGFPPLHEPEGTSPIRNEVTPMSEDPLSAASQEARNQIDTEGRYQESNDFNNHPEDTAVSLAMKKAQEDAAYGQRELEKAQEIEDAHQARSDILETQKTAMEAAKQLDIARQAGEIDYKYLSEMGDKSLMNGVDTLDLLQRLRENDLPGAISHIAENHPNPLTRKLASWLEGRVGGIEIELHPESVLREGDRSVTGYYDLKRNTIGLSGRGAASPHTLLHEVIHGLTSDFLNTKINHPLSMGLKSLYKQVSNGKGFEKFPNIYNVKEFVSEAMSNPRFQEFLKKTVVDKRTGFSKFVDSVKTILGMKVPELKTAFDHAIDLSKQVAELSSEIGRSEMLSRLNASGIKGRLADLMSTKVSEEPVQTGQETEITQAIGKMSGAAQALKDYLPAKFSTEQLLEQMKTETDIKGNLLKKTIDRFTSGGLYQSLKHPNNTLIKKTYEVIGEASDRAQTLHDTYVQPLLVSIRGMDKTEKVDASIIRTMMDAEQLEITPQELAKRGASEKIISYIVQAKKTMDAAFKSINEARAAVGKKPIDPRLGYAVTKMTGDFRKHIFRETIGEDGLPKREFIGQIGSNYRGIDKGPMSFGLAKTEAAIKAARPEWIIGPEKYMGRGAKRDSNGSRQSEYNQALQMIAEDDPHVQELAKVLSDSYASDAYAYMNAKKHTMTKKGTFGGEGRKPWEEMESNADAFFHGEVQYAETIFKWAELSKSVNEVKPLLSAAEIDQPNAKAWSDAYIDKALGNNPSTLGKALDKVFGAISESVGVGTTPISNVGRGVKAYTNTMLLGLNHLYNAVNVLQPFQGMPIVKALLGSRGLKTNFDIGTGYSYLFEGAVTAMKDKAGLGNLTEFEHKINQYGKEHHVFGNEILDRSNHLSKNLMYYGAKVTDFASNTVESGTNRVMFSGIAHMLKDSGMQVHEGLFETAYKLTKLVMHDYRAHESSMIWQDLGPVGNLSKNLTKYKLGQISQLNAMAREIPIHGSYRPIAVAMATQIASAGLLGFIAFDEADKLVHIITNKMGKPTSLRKLLLDHAPDWASYGLGSFAGVDLHARTGSPNVLPDTVGDALFPGMSKVHNTVGAATDMVSNPSEMNAKRLGRELSPPLLNGILDRNWFSTTNAKGEEMSLTRKPSDKHDIQSGTVRNDSDKMWKSLGAMGLHESKEKALDYENQRLHGDYADKRKQVVSTLIDQYVANGNKLSSAEIKAASKKYTGFEGGGSDFASDIIKGERGVVIDATTRQKLQALGGGVSGLRQFKRMQGSQ